MFAKPKENNSGFQIFFVAILYFLNQSCIKGFHIDPRKEFYDHTVIYPKLYSESTGQREINSMRGQYEDKMTISFNVSNETFLVDLHKNKVLLPRHYFEKHHEFGENVINHPMKTERSHCHYQGHLRRFNHSWAAISACDGLSGVIYDGKELYYIEPDHSLENKGHLLFKASNMVPNNLKCGVEAFKSDSQKHFSRKSLLRQKRSISIHPPYEINKFRFVEMIIVIDNEEYKKFNESKEIIFERSKQIANIISGLYSPLNISIALVGVIIWSDYDKIEINSNGDFTLLNFLRYRKEHLAVDHPNDNAQLITATIFDGAVVSKGLRGTMCTHDHSGGVTTDYSDIVGVVATAIAHGLGHNFGMEHDTEECECRDERCIMSPSFISTPLQHWSSCSLDYLNHSFSQGLDYCLKNSPLDIVGPVCGNGILEDDEECDCGLKEFCDSQCCNATSCRLFSNASCAMGDCCDTKSCQVKKAATLCRKAISECDLPEYCDGNSEFCPTDAFHQNGMECKNKKAYCYDGKCNSHEDQCKLLWGQTGNMSDINCYNQNHRGNRNGNCGYNRLNQTYDPCSEQDILCGRLHCTHQSENLEFGLEATALLRRSFIAHRGKILSCRTAIIDLGLNSVDPGLTPNGAKCGDKKICVNQKCVPVESVKENNCSIQCNGNGVCNNNGNCHCVQGYNPPYCDSPGTGGSVDSGPASDLDDSPSIMEDERSSE